VRTPARGSRTKKKEPWTLSGSRVSSLDPLSVTPVRKGHTPQSGAGESSLKLLYPLSQIPVRSPSLLRSVLLPEEQVTKSWWCAPCPVVWAVIFFLIFSFWVVAPPVSCPACMAPGAPHAGPRCALICPGGSCQPSRTADFPFWDAETALFGCGYETKIERETRRGAFRAPMAVIGLASLTDGGWNWKVEGEGLRLLDPSGESSRARPSMMCAVSTGTKAREVAGCDRDLPRAECERRRPSVPADVTRVFSPLYLSFDSARAEGSKSEEGGRSWSWNLHAGTHGRELKVDLVLRTHIVMLNTCVDLGVLQ